MVLGEGEPDEKQAVLGVSVRRSLQRVAASAPGAGAGAGGAVSSECADGSAPAEGTAHSREQMAQACPFSEWF